MRPGADFEGLLAPGERIVWADRARGRWPRSPAGVTAALAGGAVAVGGALVLALGGGGLAWVGRAALGVLLAGAAVATARPRARYALTDQGRLLVCARGLRLAVRPVDPGAARVVPPGVEVGTVDLGRVEPPLPEDAPLRLPGVGYPDVLVDLVRAGAGGGPPRGGGAG